MSVMNHQPADDDENRQQNRDGEINHVGDERWRTDFRFVGNRLDHEIRTIADVTTGTEEHSAERDGNQMGRMFGGER